MLANLAGTTLARVRSGPRLYGASVMLRCVTAARLGPRQLVYALVATSPLLMGAGEAPIVTFPSSTQSAAQTVVQPTALSRAPSAPAPKHLKPVQSDTARQITAADVAPRAPIYIRVFKEDSELEVWKQRTDGTYAHIKTYPICNFSGALGPKQRSADYQAPEGFYSVRPQQMKPDSAYHLAFNIGYPNALDKALGRTGNLIMVHGKCKSVGCFAMGDHLIEDIYALARDALAGGQAAIPVHSFPFRMTADAIARHANHAHVTSWGPLMQAYQSFEATRRVASIAMCDKRYVVNPVWLDHAPKALDPTAACPAHIEATLLPPLDRAAITAEAPRAMADGPKTRTVHNIAKWAETRSRMAALSAEARRMRRAKFQETLAARDTGDAPRSNLGGN